MTESRDGWRVSLAFWGVLLVAAGLYAAVELAPGLRTNRELESRYLVNQQRLVELERQNEYLADVFATLERDPEFARELARHDFAVSRPGDKRLAVEKSLTRDPRRPVPATAGNRPAASWSTPLISVLADNQPVRMSLLLAAAVLVLAAFTLLQESQVHRLAAIRG